MDNFKDVTISGRTFRIKKFDARTGSFMLLKVTKLLAPLFKSISLTKLSEMKDEVSPEALNISGLMEGLGDISEDDFTYIQDKCLNVCSEVLPGGLTPVLNSNGTFGAIGLEDDTATVLALTAHVLMFNVKGFFQGSPLASLVGGLLTTSPRG